MGTAKRMRKETMARGWVTFGTGSRYHWTARGLFTACGLVVSLAAYEVENPGERACKKCLRHVEMLEALGRFASGLDPKPVTCNL